MSFIAPRKLEDVSSMVFPTDHTAISLLGHDVHITGKVLVPISYFGAAPLVSFMIK